jgi:hypothetical protein
MAPVEAGRPKGPCVCSGPRWRRGGGQVGALSHDLPRRWRRGGPKVPVCARDHGGGAAATWSWRCGGPVVVEVRRPVRAGPHTPDPYTGRRMPRGVGGGEGCSPRVVGCSGEWLLEARAWGCGGVAARGVYQPRGSRGSRGGGAVANGGGRRGGLEVPKVCRNLAVHGGHVVEARRPEGPCVCSGARVEARRPVKARRCRHGGPRSSQLPMTSSGGGTVAQGSLRVLRTSGGGGAAARAPARDPTRQTRTRVGGCPGEWVVEKGVALGSVGAPGSGCGGEGAGGGRGGQKVPACA